MLKRILAWLTKVSQSSYSPLATQVAGLVFFIFLLGAFLFGTIRIAGYEFTSKTAMIIVWSLWWPFLYITIFFTARMWCGFMCPIGLVNRFGNKLRMGKPINHRRWAFLPFVLFFLIVYLEEVSGLFLSVPITIVFFLLFVLTAFAMAVVFARHSFCRLICPVGTLLGVFSRLSLIGLRTNKDICAACKEKPCITGGKTGPCPMFNNVPIIGSNKNCLLCMNCVKNCPYESAHISAVMPGEDIIEKKEISFAESFFIMSLFGMAAVLTTNGTMLARRVLDIFHLPLVGAALRGADFIIAVGASLLAFTFFGIICAKISGVRPKQELSEFGYAYLPLLFVIMLFTIAFGFLQPWLALGDWTIISFKLAFLAVGVIWSAYLIVRMASVKKRKTAVAAVQVLLLGIIAFAWVGFVTNSSQETMREGYVVKEEEIVNMSAFSMGFFPDRLIVEEGKEVILDITNQDIIHSFDIDGLGVHEILEGGSSTRVVFTPNKTGEFMFTCNIPGHTEAGMKGAIKVISAGDVKDKETQKKNLYTIGEGLSRGGGV